MPRKPTQYELTERLRDQIYAYQLAEWREFQATQARYRELLPKAFDALADALDTGGPDAVRAALALVKMADLTAAPTKPNRRLLAISDPDELLVHLPAEPVEDPPALATGE